MSNYTLIRLWWSERKGEGQTVISNTFKNLDRVTQLDMLKDCIFDLEDEYNRILEAPYRPGIDIGILRNDNT